MKKFSKFLALTVVFLFLAACGNENKPEQAETTEAPQTTVAETTQAPESKSEESSEEADNQGDESNQDEKNENAVTFKFYIHGEEDPELSFTIDDAEGKSVKEAMESQDQVPFNFNEEEGVIDSINDVENNYETWETWAYLYNGSYAELGVVSQTLEAGDEIAWYYGTADEIPMSLIQEDDDTDMEANMDEESTEETAADGQ